MVRGLKTCGEKMSWGKKKEVKKPNPKIFFVPSKELRIHGLKIGIWGPPGSGKTHFSLTFPEPIYVIDTEYGTSKVIWKKPFNEKEIYVAEVVVLNERDEVDTIKSLEQAEEAIRSLAEIFPSAREVRQPQGTIVVDSVSDIWAWYVDYLDITAKRRTRDGKPMMTEYGIINDRYRALMLMLLSRAAHVVLTAKVQDQYAMTPNGLAKIGVKPRWQKDTPYWVDLVMKMERIVSGADVKFRAKIEKCRFVKTPPNDEIWNPDYVKLVEYLDKLGVKIDGLMGGVKNK